MSQHTNDSLSAHFAASLVSARGERSQAEFARYLGIPSQQTYQRYENGLIPSGKVLHTIASKLGVTIDSLLTGGTQAEAEARGQKIFPSKEELPWGKQMEEDVHMVSAISLIFRHLSADQLTLLANEFIKSRAMTNKAKVYWVTICKAWHDTRISLESFEKLTPKQKVAARRAQNYARRAAPEASKQTA